MELLVNIFTPTVRRLLAFLLTGVILVLNQKLGLQLDPMAVGGVVALTLGYIAQSAIRQGRPPSGPELLQMLQDAIVKVSGEKPPVTAVKP